MTPEQETQTISQILGASAKSFNSSSQVFAFEYGSNEGFYATVGSYTYRCNSLENAKHKFSAAVAFYLSL